MKLIYYGLNIEFEIDDCGVSFIFLENNSEFEAAARSLYEHLNGLRIGFCCTDEGKEIDLVSKSGYIASPFDIRFDKRETQRYLIKELADELYGSVLEETISGINSSIIEALDMISGQSDYNLDYGDSLGVSDFLKRYEVRLRDPEGSFLEKVTEYCETLHKLLGKRVFFLINCDSFIEDEGFDLLDKWAKYEEISLIFLSNLQRKGLLSYRQYIIDKDLCLIK